MNRTSDMKKRLPGIILITGGIVLVAMVIQAVILSFINNRSFDRTSQVLLDQVSNVIEKNKASEEDLIDSLKEDYMVRAKAVAYIVDAKPEVANDVDELRKIAALISVDEVHLFNTDGVIYAGTNPEYFGYSFDSGEQMAYFKPMLDDKNLTMCQDVTPNTSNGKKMMYAITWNDDGTKVIRANRERNEQLAILTSMSGMYYSMHMLDLQHDTFALYTAGDLILRAGERAAGAKELMRKIVHKVVVDEHQASAQKFMDLDSLGDRLIKKKIVSGEFMVQTVIYIDRC